MGSPGVLLSDKVCVMRMELKSVVLVDVTENSRKIVKYRF
jgi:hypothetical protein